MWIDTDRRSYVVFLVLKRYELGRKARVALTLPPVSADHT